MSATPPPPPPGRVFVLFKPPGSKKFSAHILFPNGVSDVYETDSSDRSTANGLTNHRVKELQKEHGIESASQYKKRTGSQLSTSAIRVALAKGQIPDESNVRTRRIVDDDGKRLNGTPLAPGPSPISAEAQEEPSADWGQNLARIETKLAQGYQRIMALLLLGIDRDPALFLEHVRAIVTEVTLHGLTPTGRLQKKRGRPPGS